MIPIVVGYTIAHYFSFAVFQGQAGYLLATDPLGRGWRLFGDPGAINYAVISPQAIAWVQIAAIVIGHILGVAAAHDRALPTLPRSRRASIRCSPSWSCTRPAASPSRRHMTPLAHGAVGGWDELALLLCPFVFLLVLIIAGRRRRTQTDDEDPSE